MLEVMEKTKTDIHSSEKYLIPSVVVKSILLLMAILFSTVSTEKIITLPSIEGDVMA
jgi:hypothetical protein